MSDNHTVITLLGSAGEGAKSILSTLNKSVCDKNDPIYHLISSSTIHLIDVKQKKEAYYRKLFPNLQDKFVLHQFDVRDTKTFIKHLEMTHTTLVIDVSWADTVEMVTCCNKLGIRYVFCFRERHD